MSKEKSATAGARALNRIRWARLRTKAERSASVGHEGGRPRIFPKCPRYRCHQWNPNTGRCACGAWRKNYVAKDRLDVLGRRQAVEVTELAG
jgi:hypothetical protein